jgi:hypothetical protein
VKRSGLRSPRLPQQEKEKKERQVEQDSQVLLAQAKRAMRRELRQANSRVGTAD